MLLLRNPAGFSDVVENFHIAYVRSRLGWGRLEVNGYLIKVGADLEGANLENANLKNADLANANLKNANLKHAQLQNLNLEGANLRGANLEGANLLGAWGLKYGAKTRGTNFAGVIGPQLEQRRLTNIVWVRSGNGIVPQYDLE